MYFVKYSSIFTARVRSTTGRYCFHRCLSVHRGGGQVQLVGGSGPAGRGGQVQGGPGSGPARGGGSGPASGGGSAKIGQQNE